MTMKSAVMPFTTFRTVLACSVQGERHLQFMMYHGDSTSESSRSRNLAVIQGRRFRSKLSESTQSTFDNNINSISAKSAIPVLGNVVASLPPVVYQPGGVCWGRWREGGVVGMDHFQNNTVQTAVNDRLQRGQLETGGVLQPQFKFETIPTQTPEHRKSLTGRGNCCLTLTSTAFACVPGSHVYHCGHHKTATRAD